MDVYIPARAGVGQIWLAGPKGGDGSGPSDLERAILRTLLYADIFDYPLTAEEISHWAIGMRVTPAEVAECLAASQWLAERVECADDRFSVCGRAGLAAVRAARARAAARLWPLARRYARLLGHLPFVRMVAVTGALALDNADEKADIDLLIVTAPGRVWLARALAVGCVYLARRDGIVLCPNYVLAETALVHERRDLYTAHEFVQMIPLVGHALYTRMRALNAWCEAYIPNARQPWRHEPDLAPAPAGRKIQGALEHLLGGWLGERLEAWERRRKLRKFAPQAALPGTGAILDERQVKGHFRDYGGPTLQMFHERCRVHGVDEGVNT